MRPKAPTHRSSRDNPTVSIRPSDVGKRVTVQFFDDDGARVEAVGLLEKAEVMDGAPILHIRKKDDTLVSVPLRRIRNGRVVR